MYKLSYCPLINIQWWLLVFLFCLNNTIQAQTNFVQGYVITIDQDTIHGEINYQNWVFTPQQIQFKSGSKVDEFTYKEISGFGVKQKEFYTHYFVDVLTNPIEIGYIVDRQKPILEKSETFLQLLVKGSKSLWYYKDENSVKHFFIQEGKETPVPLIYMKYIKDEPTDQFSQELHEYRNQLTTYFKDGDITFVDLQKVNYNRKSLIDIFKRYNQAIDPRLEYEVKKDKMGLDLSANAGPVLTSTRFSGSGPFQIEEADFGLRINYQFGLALNLEFKRNLKRFSLYNEFSYKSFQTEGTSNIPILGGEITNDFNFNFAYLRLGNFFRVQWPLKKVKPFIQLGMINSLMIKEEQSVLVKNPLTITPEREEIPFNEIRKYEQSLALGVGVRWQGLIIELRTERGNGFSKAVNLNTHINNLAFLVGYTFYRKK